MTIKFANFFQNNSPKVIQIIGDIGLLCSFISVNMLAFKQELISIGLTSFANNPLLDRISAIALFTGILVKFATKFFGSAKPKEENNNSQP